MLHLFEDGDMKRLCFEPERFVNAAAIAYITAELITSASQQFAQ